MPLITAQTSATIKTAYTTIKILSAAGKFGKSKLEKEYSTFRTLKRLNLIKRNDDFNSLYLHTLFEFEKESSKSLVKLFSIKEVISSFEKQFRDQNDWSFKTELEHNLHTNPIVRKLKNEDVNIEIELLRFSKLFDESLKKMLPPSLTNITQKLDENNSQTNDIHRMLTELHSQNYEAALNESYLKDLDYPGDLIDNYQPQQALKYLIKFKEDKWKTSSDLIKYKVLVNTGLCYVQMHEEEKGANLIIQAEQYNPDSPKGLGFYALGYAILKNHEGFERIYNKAIKLGDVAEMVYSSLIMIDDGKTPIESLLDKIPVEIQSKTNISAAIGRQYGIDRDLENCIKWYEIAISNLEKDPYQLQGALGSCILSIVVDADELMTGQIGADTKKYIPQAIELLTQAWQGIKEPEMKKAFFYWVMNRGIAKKFINDKEGAYQDIKEAATLVENLLTLRHYAIASLESNKIDDAISILKKILDSNYEGITDAKIELMLAELYINKKNFQEAIELIKRYLSKVSDDRKNEARSMLVRAYIELKDFESAIEENESLRVDSPEWINGHTDAIEIANLQDRKQDAVGFLKHAKTLINERTRKDEIYVLGNHALDLEEYEIAAELYELIANKSAPSVLLNRLVSCYFNMKNYQNVIDISETLKLNGHHDPVIIEREIIIYQSTNIPKAIQVAEDLLNRFPDEKAIIIRLATLYIHEGRKTDAHEILNRVNYERTLSLEASFHISKLLIAVGDFSKGIEFVYLARRDNYDLSKAHENYVNTFLFLLLESGGSEVEILETSDLIEKGSAVSLKANNNSVTDYTIEDFEDSTISRNELKSSSELAKMLLGKKVGEVITLNEDFGIPTTLEIVGVNNKYVLAKEISMNLLQNTFANRMGIKVISGSGETEEEQTRSLVDTLLSQLDRSQERDDEIINLYQTRLLSIGHFADLKGTSELEIWAGLVADEELGVMAGVSSMEEYTSCQALVSQNRPIILDLSSLLTLYSIDGLENILVPGNKLIVGRKVIESLRKYITNNERIGELGKVTIAKKAGQVVRFEQSKEELQEQINKVKKLIEWINSNCSVESSTSILSIDAELRQQILQYLGETSTEAILLAQENNGLLYSEEFCIRSVASQQFSVCGMSTQVFMNAITQSGLLEKEKYNDYMATLLNMNYKLMIDKDLLMFTLEKSEYKVLPPFTKSTKILNGKNSDEDSAFAVSAAFLKDLYLTVKLKEQRDHIALFVINEVFKDRENSLAVYFKFASAVAHEFSLLPIHKEELTELLDQWIRTNKKRPI